MEQLSEIVIAINDHRLVIYLISLVVFALFSFTMWAAHQRAKNERWMWYFAWAFAISSLQYGLLTAFWLGRDHIEKWYVLFFPILQICSAANNLFLLGAARDLQNEKRGWPKWAQWLAVGTAVTTLFGSDITTSETWLLLLLQRGPDTILSALTVAYVAFAIFANVSNRRSLAISLRALAFAVVYALVYVVWGLNPLLAPYLIPGGTYSDSLIVADSILWAVALPLRVSLCMITFLLMLRYFETFNALTKLQDLSIGGRQDYLSSEGVVRIISKMLTADISLSVVLPGQKDQRIAYIGWPSGVAQKSTKIVRREEIQPFVRKVLTGEGESIWQRGNGTSDGNETAEATTGLSAVIAVPIETHGATIGCLQVARRDYPFSQMAVKQIRELADLISPAVQSYRELASLDKLNIEFAREQDREICDPEAAARKIAVIIHDILSPVVTRLHMNFGFTETEQIYCGKDHVLQAMRAIDWHNWFRVPEDIYTREFATPFKLLKKRLTARSVDTSGGEAGSSILEEERVIIGDLALAVHEHGDAPARPTLGTNYLHRKAAATLAANAYNDFVLNYYSDLLRSFGLEIGKRLLSVEHWYGLVNKTAKAAGLAWAVVEQNEAPELLGAGEVVSLVRALKEEQRDPFVSDTTSKINIRCISLGEPIAGAKHVLQLSLPTSGGYIWLGVSRPDFGPELSFFSPWKMFLLNYAQIADAALERIIAAGRFQRMQIEAAQYQGLATAAVTTGTIAHQLSNLVHGQSASVSTLIDALLLNRLTTDEDLARLIHSMKGSAEQMRRLLLSLTRVTKTDERRPCQLREAVQQAGQLFAVSLLQRGIRLEIDIADNLYLDVPFNVAALAIANLVGNAKDAMAYGGTIRVEAEANADMVLCRVLDQGKGVSPEMRDRIFELGATSKENGSGWGLYLTMRSLLENRSYVELTKSDEQGSIFTIRFPKPKRQEAR